MFTKLYLDTTNPNLTLQDMFQMNILFPMIISIIFHTCIYGAAVNLASYIFFGNMLNPIVNKRFLISLLVIMIFGFFARFFHVKEIYRAYNGDLQKTRQHMDKMYISWIFIS